MIQVRINRIAVERLLAQTKQDGKRPNDCIDILIIDDKAQTVTVYNTQSGYERSTYAEVQATKLD
jgi:hypothetical protein